MAITIVLCCSIVIGFFVRHILDIQKEVLISKFNALASALSKADIKLIMSGEKSSNLFGLDFNAENGANLDQFLVNAGVDISKLPEALKILKDK